MTTTSSEPNFTIFANKGFQGGSLHIFKELDSTNTYLSANLKNHKNGDIILARRQTRGRGRSGRSWYSPQAKNISGSLTFSILHKLEKEKSLLPNIGQTAAISIAELLSEKLPLKNVEIKWPNDILCNKKKIAGLLGEISSQDDNFHLILGIGLNINLTPEELSLIDRRATSIHSECGLKPDGIKLLADFLTLYDNNFLMLKKGGFNSLMPKWEQFFKLNGKTLFYHQGSKQTKIKVIKTLSDGSLEAENETGRTILKWGELTFE